MVADEALNPIDKIIKNWVVTFGEKCLHTVVDVLLMSGQTDITHLPLEFPERE
jgi:hypothetical protein